MASISNSRAQQVHGVVDGHEADAANGITNKNRGDAGWRRQKSQLI